MSDTPGNRFDGTGSQNVGFSLQGVPLTRINPERPSRAAAAHLRFWQDFSDTQIEQVLGTNPLSETEHHHLMSIPTAANLLSLSDADFGLREFLYPDTADTSLVAAQVSTGSDVEHYLEMESTLTLSDGSHIANLDLSVFGSTETESERKDAYESLSLSIQAARALQEAVQSFVTAHVDACLEAVQVLESYKVSE